MVRLTDRPDMTLDVYRGRKTTMQHNEIAPILADIFNTSLAEGVVPDHWKNMPQ